MSFILAIESVFFVFFFINDPVEVEHSSVLQKALFSPGQ